MSRADELRAELAAAELEERFLEAKASFEAGTLPEADYREIKQAFHAARVAHREQREAARGNAEAQEIGSGDVAVMPETVRGGARPTDIGGSTQ